MRGGEPLRLTWDIYGLILGALQRSTIYVDVLTCAIFWRDAPILGYLSSLILLFAVGIFIFLYQIRMMLSLFRSRDAFSFEKPDLFFKSEDSQPFARPHPAPSIKVANCAMIWDFTFLGGVLLRYYIPMIDGVESQEFAISINSIARCFCEDIVQVCLKFFFLLDFGFQQVVLVSLVMSFFNAALSCAFTSSDRWGGDISDDEEDYDW